jgi:hypothetical protein
MVKIIEKMRSFRKSKEMLDFPQECGKLRPTQMNLDRQKPIHAIRFTCKRNLHDIEKFPIIFKTLTLESKLGNDQVLNWDKSKEKIAIRTKQDSIQRSDRRIGRNRDRNYRDLGIRNLDPKRVKFRSSRLVPIYCSVIRGWFTTLKKRN